MTPLLYVLIGVAVVAVAGVAGWLVTKKRSTGWDQLDDSGPSELLPSPAAGAKPAAKKPAAKKPAAKKEEKPSGSNLFGRLVNGLARTKGRMVSRMDDLFRGRKVIDDALWQELEELLITSDVGVRTTTRLLEEMRGTADREELEDPARLRELLADSIRKLLVENAGRMLEPTDGPLVIMVVGVNGAGKTTTIGKLAARHVAAGRKTIIAAGDTFRAAAIEQVVVWGKRAGADVVRNEQGSDPAAVAHDAITKGIARKADVIICDTAGRLHSKGDLMRELQKVYRVVGKVLPGAPHETLLVLDSTNGQNAIAQAREFGNSVGVTGIAMTKLDGTARGGVIIGISDELDIPIKLIGIGEAVDDLRDFDPDAFVDALFASSADGLGRGSNSADAAAADEEAGIRLTEEDLEKG
jgi:fused signal recognition particle receptor